VQSWGRAKLEMMCTMWKVAHFIQQRSGRTLAFDPASTLAVAARTVKCGYCVFEFMGQPSRHSPRLSRFSERTCSRNCVTSVISVTGKARPAHVVRGESLSAYCCSNSSWHISADHHFNLFLDDRSSTQQTLFHHLRQVEGCAEAEWDGWPRSACQVEECASRSLITSSVHSHRLR